jgi:hypothetical protein
MGGAVVLGVAAGEVAMEVAVISAGGAALEAASSSFGEGSLRAASGCARRDDDAEMELPGGVTDVG